MAACDGLVSAFKDTVETVFNAIGIDNKNITHAFRTSFKLFDDGSDAYELALTRAVLANPKNGAGFFRNYWKEINRSGNQLRIAIVDANRSANDFNLPGIQVVAGNTNKVANTAALTAERGSGNVETSYASRAPEDLSIITHELEISKNYQREDFTLTHTDPYSNVVHSDWILDGVDFDVGSNQWLCLVSREHFETVFRFDGAEDAVLYEGAASTLTIKANKPIPAGESVVFNLGYSGDAEDGVDYTAPLTVTMASGLSEVSVDIVGLEGRSAVGNNVVVTVNSYVVSNPSVVGESRFSQYGHSRALTILPSDTISLFAADVVVSDEETSVQVVLTLDKVATAPFTVDYSLVSGSALPMDDYVPASGVLNFTGAQETQNVEVGFSVDLDTVDFKQLRLVLSNCTDPDVDLSGESTITIVRSRFERDPVIDTSTEISDGVTTFARPDHLRELSLIMFYTEPSGRERTWIYPYSSGAYPDVESSVNTLTGVTTLPLNPVVIDKFALGDPTPTPYMEELDEDVSYNLNLMGIDLVDIVDLIKSNAAYGNIDDVAVIFAISPTDDYQSVGKAFWYYWTFLTEQADMKSDYGTYAATTNAGDTFKTAFLWDQHTFSDNVDTTDNYDLIAWMASADVGDCMHTVVRIPSSRSSYSHGTYREFVHVYKEWGRRHVRYITPEHDNVSVYRKISSTRVDQLLIEGLRSDSYVRFSFEGQDYHRTMSVGSFDPEFLLPLTEFITDNLSARELAEIYPLAVRVDVWGGYIETVRYYATSEFGLLLDIVKVVITVLFWYAGGGGWVDLLIELAYTFAVSELVVFAVTEVVKETGSAELGLVVALVAAIMTSESGFDPETFTDPVMLTQLVTDFSNNATLAFTQDSINTQKRAAEANRALTLREEKLDELKSLLAPDLSDLVASIPSIDTLMVQAGPAQYDYDSLYGYDNLITNYNDNKLKLGFT
jgi:hypothetical protein